MIEPSNIILQAFDVNNDWNSKNRSQQPKGRWQDSMTAGGSRHQGMKFLYPFLVVFMKFPKNINFPQINEMPLCSFLNILFV